MGKVTDPAILEQLNAPAASAPRSGNGAPLRGGRIITDPVYAREQRTAAREDARIGMEQERLDLTRAAAEREEQRFRSEQAVMRRQTRAAINDIDGQLARARSILDNPDLASITGSAQGLLGENLLSIGSYIPGIGEGPLDVYRQFESLVDKGGLNELQRLREMSPTGGAVGQVSDFEQKLLQRAAGEFTSRRQSDAAYRARLEEYIARLETSRDNLVNAYRDDYGEDILSASSGATTSPSDDNVVQEFDWSPDKGVTPRGRQ